MADCFIFSTMCCGDSFPGVWHSQVCEGSARDFRQQFVQARSKMDGACWESFDQVPLPFGLLLSLIDGCRNESTATMIHNLCMRNGKNGSVINNGSKVNAAVARIALPGCMPWLSPIGSCFVVALSALWSYQQLSLSGVGWSSPIGILDSVQLSWLYLMFLNHSDAVFSYCILCMFEPF